MRKRALEDDMKSALITLDPRLGNDEASKANKITAKLMLAFYKTHKKSDGEVVNIDKEGEIKLLDAIMDQSKLRKLLGEIGETIRTPAEERVALELNRIHGK